MFLVQFSSQGSQSLVLHIFLWAWKSNTPTHRQLALCTCMYHDYEESAQFMVCTRGDVWYSQTSNSLCFTSPKWQRPLKHVPTVTTASQQCPVNEQLMNSGCIQNLIFLLNKVTNLDPYHGSFVTVSVWFLFY